MRPTLRLALGLVLLCVSTCGNGPDESRPIEMLFFAQGPTGAQFSFEEEGNDPDCLAFSEEDENILVPSAGRGIQSVDAEHLFPYTFTAPYLFVIENEEQPVRAVFRNLSDSTPLNVLRVLVLGVLDSREIGPELCRSFTSFSDAEEAVATPPVQRGDDVRVDVCSFDRDLDLPSGFRCTQAASLGGDPTLVDTNAVFLASIGDLESTFRTRCLQPQGSERNECQTPATLFLNNPKDTVSVVVSPLSNQAERRFHADLYIDGELRDSDTSLNDVIVTQDI